MRHLFLLAMAASSAWSADIVLPVAPLERDGPVPAIYRTNQLATGKGELSVRWTDVYGRVVEDRRIPVELIDENEIGFTLDLRRAVSMRNELTAHLHFEGPNKKGAAGPARRGREARIHRQPARPQLVGLPHHHVAAPYSGAGGRTEGARNQRRPMGRAQPDAARISCFATTCAGTPRTSPPISIPSITATSRTGRSTGSSSRPASSTRRTAPAMSR